MTYQTKAELREDISILQAKFQSLEESRARREAQIDKFTIHVVTALGIRDAYVDGWGIDEDRLYADFEALVTENTVKTAADRLRKAIKNARKADS